MLPFKLVYHPGYNLDLGTHVFPARKYRLIRDGLVAKGIADPADILAPEPASDEDVLRVHTAEYVHKLKTGTLTASEQMRLELPFSQQVVDAFWLAAGGSILAAQCAMQDGFGINIGGGFHHAFPGHGEGFCMLNDVAIARALDAGGSCCRAHSGRGYRRASGQRHGVHLRERFAVCSRFRFTRPGTIRSRSRRRTWTSISMTAWATKSICASCSRGLDECFSRCAPDLVFYVAGADPYREDQLGGLSLTIAGLRQRDDLVLGEARRRGVPVAITFAGGYARNTEDTVRIHMNTVLAARDCADQ